MSKSSTYRAVYPLFDFRPVPALSPAGECVGGKSNPRPDPGYFVDFRTLRGGIDKPVIRSGWIGEFPKHGNIENAKTRRARQSP